MVNAVTKDTSNSNKKHAIIKIIIMMGVIGTGGVITSIGFLTLSEEPTINTHGGKGPEIRLPSGIAEFHTTHTAPGGFFPGYNIGTHVQLTLEEEIVNSTNIQVVFLGGRVSSIVDRSLISVYDDPVILDYHSNRIQVGKNVTVYDTDLELRYDTPGSYDVEILIEMQDKEPHKEKLPNMIEIKSREDYTNQKNKNEQYGFALMILGISLISTSPAFTKVFEYWEDIKNN